MSNRDEVVEILTDIALDADPRLVVTEDCTLEDLGFDDLSMLFVLTRAEEAFDVDIPDLTVTLGMTVGEAADAIVRYTGE